MRPKTMISGGDAETVAANLIEVGFGKQMMRVQQWARWKLESQGTEFPSGAGNFAPKVEFTFDKETSEARFVHLIPLEGDALWRRELIGRVSVPKSCYPVDDTDAWHKFHGHAARTKA